MDDVRTLMEVLGGDGAPGVSDLSEATMFELERDGAPLATILAHARSVFGSDPEMVSWLRTPQPVLDGRRPVDLLGDSDSRQAVDDVLTRIEHGVFA